MTSLFLRAASWVSAVLPPAVKRMLYRLGPVSGGLRKLLTSALPQELAVVEVSAGPLRGARLELNLKTEKTLWLGMYELELLEAIERFAPDGGLAYDVGANLGYVSLALARRLGRNGRVIAFEPLPHNLRRLRANLNLNPEGQRVQVVPTAVGERTARKMFLVHRSTGMGKLAGSRGRSAEYGDELAVDVVALDDWMQQHAEPPPQLVKIDVEGGEQLVLTGMTRLLRAARPVLLLELHGPEAAAASFDILEASEYSMRDMRPGYPQLSQAEAWKAYIVALPAEQTGILTP